MEKIKELCSLIIGDRLAGNSQQGSEGLLECVDAIWTAFGNVVVDVHTEFPVMLLESWAFTKVDEAASAAKSDLKLVVKSLLCYSKFHAWRKLTNKDGLSRVRVSVHNFSTRLSFGEEQFNSQDSPVAALPTIRLGLSLRSLNKAFQLVLPVVESLPSIEADLDQAVQGMSIKMVPRKAKISPTRPGAASPDPRRCAVTMDSNSAPISIPRRSRLSDPPPLLLADGRIAPSPPLRGPVDHRGVFLSPPVVAVPRTSSFSRPSSISRTPPTQFLSSLEESLLAGRLPATSANPVQGFMADIGASGLGYSPPHLRLPLNATYYHLPGEEAPSPYVGVIDLVEGLRGQKHPGLYRVPCMGLVQVVICNPLKTGIKVFLIKYDFRAMPPSTHTFLRQRTYVSSSPASRGTLQYAIHIRFQSSKRGHIYIHKDIRVIFSHRAPDISDHQRTTMEGPTDPVFTPCDSFRYSPSKSVPEEPLGAEHGNESGIVASPDGTVPGTSHPLASRLVLSQ